MAMVLSQPLSFLLTITTHHHHYHQSNPTRVVLTVGPDMMMVLLMMVGWLGHDCCWRPVIIGKSILATRTTPCCSQVKGGRMCGQKM